MTSKPTPVACSLGAHDAEHQALEWADLQRLATSSHALKSGAQMMFPAGLAAKVADLAAREVACCAFLDIVTTFDGDELVLSITSDDPDAIAVIGALSGVDVP